MKWDVDGEPNRLLGSQIKKIENSSTFSICTALIYEKILFIYERNTFIYESDHNEGTLRYGKIPFIYEEEPFIYQLYIKADPLPNLEYLP
jgi:hypothetical protein